MTTVKKRLQDIKVDKEFEARLKPLEPLERKQLKENIQRDGIEEPLVLWGDILIDGHNRFKICKELGINPVPTVQREGISDRYDALEFIITNQMGRRNCTTDDKNILIGILHNIRKSKQGGDHMPKAKGQLGPLLNVAKEISKEFGVPERTVKRAGYVEEAKDKARSLGYADVVKKMESKEIKIDKDTFTQMSNNQTFPDVLEEMRTTGKAPKKETLPPKVKTEEPEGIWDEVKTESVDEMEVFNLLSEGSYIIQIEKLAKLSKLFFIIKSDTIMNTPSKYQEKTLELIRGIHDHAHELLELTEGRVQIADVKLTEDEVVIDADYKYRSET